MLIFIELSDKLGTKLLNIEKFSIVDSLTIFLSSSEPDLFSSLIFFRGGLDFEVVDVVGSVKVSVKSKGENK